MYTTLIQQIKKSQILLKLPTVNAKYCKHVQFKFDFLTWKGQIT